MVTLDADRSVQITRVVRAPREKVFDAFVVPELRRRWWGARPGHRCTICEIDGRVGGRYRINMVTDEEEHIVAGTFVEFVRPEKLVFTWSWEKPADGIQNSVVTILLIEPAPGTAQLTLTHTSFAMPEGRDRHHAGWSGCLDSLQAEVERSKG